MNVSRAFSVPQEPKRRRRIIFDAIGENVLCHDCPKIRINGTKVIRRIAKQNKFAASFDFKAWFFQFRALGQYYAFRDTSGQWYAPVRAPMGHKFHVFCAHTVTKVLLSMALVESSVARVAYDVISTTFSWHTMIQHSCKPFHLVCRRYNATIGEYVSTRQIVEHRGMVTSARPQLRSRRHGCNGLHKRLSIAKSIRRGPTSVIGMLVWALLILNEASRLG